MLMTFVDRAFGMTARLTSGVPRDATVSMLHQFVAPLQIGSFAMVKAKDREANHTDSLCEGTVYSGDEPILQAHGVWRLAARS